MRVRCSAAEGVQESGALGCGFLSKIPRYLKQGLQTEEEHTEFHQDLSMLNFSYLQRMSHNNSMLVLKLKSILLS